jgi:hypothetical protein
MVGTGDVAGRCVGAGRGVLLRGELVEAQGDALGGVAVVDEHDRRGVGLDELEELRVDRRPDRTARGLATGERLQRVRLLAGWKRIRFGHRLDGDLDPQVQILSRAGVDDRHLAVRADEEPADLLERALGGAQADALNLPGRAGGGLHGAV